MVIERDQVMSGNIKLVQVQYFYTKIMRIQL
jgi:hypothetical protein